MAFLLLFDLAHLPLQDREARLATAIGSGDNYSNAYWLNKQGLTLVSNDRIAMIFGYVDDKEGCDIIAKELSDKYSDPKLYYCSRIN